MAVRALSDTARITALALASAAASFAASPAFAGAGEVTTVVTPLSTNVSFTESVTDPIFIVYAVSVKNEVGNTINNIVFTGATKVVDVASVPPTPTSALAKYDSATGTTCTTINADRTAISCTVGQLKAGASTVFYVTFVAPATVAVPQPATSFDGTTYYAEGTGGLENSTPQNSTRSWIADNVFLGTASPNNIKSGVPQVNRTLKFFTAPNPLGELSDQITTTVSVAGTAPITSTLTIVEAALPTDNTSCIAQGNFYRCYESTLTIPDDTSTTPPTPFQYPSGSGKYLGITLRIGPAAIKPGFKTSNVRVTYEGAPVYECQVTSPTGAPITYAALPCYTGIVYYKNWTKNSSWPKAWEGSVDVFGVNDKNGPWTVR